MQDMVKFTVKDVQPTRSTNKMMLIREFRDYARAHLPEDALDVLERHRQYAYYLRLFEEEPDVFEDFQSGTDDSDYVDGEDEVVDETIAFCHDAFDPAHDEKASPEDDVHPSSAEEEEKEEPSPASTAQAGDNGCADQVNSQDHGFSMEKNCPVTDAAQVADGGTSTQNVASVTDSQAISEDSVYDHDDKEIEKLKAELVHLTS